ncbi:endolytic transglycosylase MltG [Microbacterium sp.]|uniref:endolytic transglycosylase MltG n=1 Tax=Microbacterium sp. TaxID=51671 RepID=UPI0028112A7D|nr:endolytic transglycosylase MltG [Microbacterium sp.]
MSDPTRDGKPLTRRQARQASRAPQDPNPPAAAEEGPADAAGPVPASRSLPWDQELFRGPSGGSEATIAPPPAARRGTAPATLAETATRAADEPDAADSEPASLDDLFVPENTVDAKPRRGGRGCLVTLVILLAILGGIVAGGFYLWNTYGPAIQERFGWDGPSDYEEGQATGEATITIEEGDGGEAISQKLYEAGVTLKPDSFYDHLIAAEAIPLFYPGVYQLQQKMTSAAALAAIEDPANRLENAVALQEGLTVEATLEAASAGLDMPLEELQAAASDPSAFGVEGDSLEGWLFPANYTFDPGVTAEDAIRAMVDRTRESLSAAGVPEGQEHEILTIASIIQREARFQDDFYKVSRVIQNRLDPAISDTGGLLQMDSTAQYGYGEMHDGTVSSSEEALQDDNPWNTYVHTGLPAGPISNPGDVAIDAALKPAEGPWQYFVTVNLDTGETVFSETLGEHERAISQWHEWCEANPDSGC